MINFYSQQRQWKLEFFIFSIEALIHELSEDSKKRAKVIVLLTASPNYWFGKSQQALFGK